MLSCPGVLIWSSNCPYKHLERHKRTFKCRTMGKRAWEGDQQWFQVCILCINLSLQVNKVVQWLKDLLSGLFFLHSHQVHVCDKSGHINCCNLLWIATCFAHERLELVQYLTGCAQRSETGKFAGRCPGTCCYQWFWKGCCSRWDNEGSLQSRYSPCTHASTYIYTATAIDAFSLFHCV